MRGSAGRTERGSRGTPHGADLSTQQQERVCPPEICRGYVCVKKKPPSCIPGCWSHCNRAPMMSSPCCQRCRCACLGVQLHKRCSTAERPLQQLCCTPPAIQALWHSCRGLRPPCTTVKRLVMTPSIGPSQHPHHCTVPQPSCNAPPPFRRGG